MPQLHPATPKDDPNKQHCTVRQQQITHERPTLSGTEYQLRLVYQSGNGNRNVGIRWAIESYHHVIASCDDDVTPDYGGVAPDRDDVTRGRCPAILLQ